MPTTTKWETLSQISLARVQVVCFVSYPKLVNIVGLLLGNILSLVTILSSHCSTISPDFRCICCLIQIVVVIRQISFLKWFSKRMSSHSHDGTDHESFLAVAVSAFGLAGQSGLLGWILSVKVCFFCLSFAPLKLIGVCFCNDIGSFCTRQSSILKRKSTNQWQIWWKFQTNFWTKMKTWSHALVLSQHQWNKNSWQALMPQCKLGQQSQSLTDKRMCHVIQSTKSQNDTMTQVSSSQQCAQMKNSNLCWRIWAILPLSNSAREHQNWPHKSWRPHHRSWHDNRTHTKGWVWTEIIIFHAKKCCKDHHMDMWFIVQDVPFCLNHNCKLKQPCQWLRVSAPELAAHCVTPHQLWKHQRNWGVTVSKWSQQRPTWNARLLKTMVVHWKC